MPRESRSSIMGLRVSGRERNEEREREREDHVIPGLHRESISLLWYGIEPGERGGAQQPGQGEGEVLMPRRQVSVTSRRKERVNERDRASWRLTRQLVPSSSIGSTQEYIGDTQTTPSLFSTLPYERCTNGMIRRTRLFARCVAVGRSWRSHPHWNHRVTWRRASLMSDVCASFSLPVSLFFLYFSVSLVPSCLRRNKLIESTAGANCKVSSMTQSRKMSDEFKFEMRLFEDESRLSFY